MKIDNVIELNEGNTVRFDGELSGKELKYVLELGLTVLLYQGALSNVTVAVPASGEVH